MRVGNVTSPDYCMRGVDFIYEATALGGWQAVQEEGDCLWWYFLEKKERNCGLVK